MFSYTLTKDWALITITTCFVLFPLVDPLISRTWAGLLGGLSSNTSGGVFVDQVGAFLYVSL
jgi:hypothetical protein